MPPGSTSRPVASIVSAAPPRLSPSATMRPSLTPTSQRATPFSVATVPFLMSRSNVAIVNGVYALTSPQRGGAKVRDGVRGGGGPPPRGVPPPPPAAPAELGCSRVRPLKELAEVG